MSDNPIENEREYEAALAELARLMDLGEQDTPNLELDTQIEALAERIQAYERIHYPMGDS